MNKLWIPLGLLLLIALPMGCSKGGDDSGSQAGGTAATSSPGAITPEQALETFKQRCSTCHGDNGTGTGPGSATLNPKPRNFHDKTWQASVTDQQIENTIKVGGAAVGKSPAMPAQPDLASKPEVLAGLRNLIRNFGKN
jgi:mono/diheme cytochrome c family protein